MNYPIEVRIIADSLSPCGARLTTFELSYPRWIHAELRTHRALSMCSQSSRAVPVKKVQKVNKKPAEPFYYGSNIPGMSSEDSLEGWRLRAAKAIWKGASRGAFFISGLLGKVGLHKQWANRITEPFSTIKVVVTGTDFDNFFWLRTEMEAVQPELYVLANKMQEAYNLSIPKDLSPGHWHLPYVDSCIVDDEQFFFDCTGKNISEDEALKISASCCAQVSYRNLDESLEKALSIFEKLFNGTRPHLSPTEHQGRVMKPLRESSLVITSIEGVKTCVVHPDSWEEGVTALSRDGKLKSGNLTGFIQYRQLLPTGQYR